MMNLVKKYWEFVSCAIIGLLVIGPNLLQHGIPLWGSVPTFFSPAITAGLSVNQCWRYIRKGEVTASVLLMIWVLLICGYFPYAQEWYLHIICVILLYIGYNFWDRVTMKAAQLGNEDKAEIKMGHEFINMPTLASLVLALGFVGIMYIYVLDFDRSFGALPTFTTDADRLLVREAIVSAFANGLVTFQLFIGAIAYFIISRRLAISKNSEALVRDLTGDGQMVTQEDKESPPA